jgi:2-polyprenyl-3-methyl-5-hydroxy-6-metoxy-1,4-benzoquinol methylase
MSEFDAKAGDWDKNPVHWDRSVAIADEILKIIPIKPYFRAMEFGAGTGILSFLLRDTLNEILLIDNSAEMIKMIDEKIASSGATNLKTRFFDLEQSELNGYKFDLIFTQMVLHHVSEVTTVIAKFSRLLNPGGYLAIADLYPEDGSFHGQDIKVHRGFDLNFLTEVLQRNSFVNISHQQCFIISRQISTTEKKDFPVFLLTAERV